VNATTSESKSRLRLLWPAIGGTLLVAWTAYCQITWAHRTGHLHGLLAFFLGLLVLILGDAFVRQCVGVVRFGWRWLLTREASRLRLWSFAFGVSAVVLFYSVELWRGKRAWASVAREANLRGEKLELIALVPPPVPEEQDFAQAPFFAQMFAVAAGKGQGSAHHGTEFPVRLDDVTFWGLWPVKLSQFPRNAPWLEQARADLRAWLDRCIAGDQTARLYEAAMNSASSSSARNGTNLPPTADSTTVATALLAKLRAYEPILNELRPYSQRPYCRFPFDPKYRWHPGVLEGLLRLLQVRAAAGLAGHQDEAAFQDAHLSLRLLDYLLQRPWAGTVGYFGSDVRDAIQPLWEGLADRRWSNEQLAVLEGALSRLDCLAAYESEVRFGALSMADFVESLVPTSKRTVPRAHSAVREEGVGLWFVRAIYPTGWSLQDQAAIHQFHLQTTSRYLDMKSRRIVGKRHGEPRGLFSSSDSFFPIYMTPRVWQMFADAAESFPFAQTAVDLATLACALERYRLANGEFPATLAALVPQFVARLPHDIITGEPLKYRRTDGGGFLLYSVGFNKTDDGGKPCVRYKNLHGQPENRFDLDQNDWVWIHPDRKPGA